MPRAREIGASAASPCSSRFKASWTLDPPLQAERCLPEPRTMTPLEPSAEHTSTRRARCSQLRRRT